MDRIQRKSAIGRTSSFLLAALEGGEEFLWERFEKQLPLCAFTANGLSCRKCFHGPCRINPFGDEPNRGVCGADRDQIVMEALFQATLEGVLNTARAAACLDGKIPDGEFPDVASDLPPETARALVDRKILPVRKSQLWSVQNSYFVHKKYLARTLEDLTRLGLIQYGILKESASKWAAVPRESPPFAPEGINIFVEGHVPFSLVDEFLAKARRGVQGKKVNLLFHGSEALPGLPMMADLGSPEFSLASDLIDALVLAPDSCFPALGGMAEKKGMPVLLFEDALPGEKFVQKTLDLALQHHLTRGSSTLPSFSPALVASSPPIYDRAAEIREFLQSGRLGGILVILGETNVKQTFFGRTLELMEYGLNHSLLVLVAGGVAAQAESLSEELIRRLGRDSIPENLSYLGSDYEFVRLIAFLRGLNSGESFHRLPAIISFPEFFRTATWANAVTCLSFGLPVQIGTRLPFWGSPSLTEALLHEWPQITGGKLLASPALVEPRAQAEEIGAYLRMKSGK